jgi:hypothetical protein
MCDAIMPRHLGDGRLAKSRKLLLRLSTHPKDFTWDELATLMKHLGFEKREGAGSGASFHCLRDPSRVIHLHKPHNRNPPTLLVVYVRAVHARLQDWGYYDDQQ